MPKRTLHIIGIILLGISIALPFVYCVVHGFTLVAPLFWLVIVGLIVLAKKEGKLTEISPKKAFLITTLILLTIVIGISLL